LYFVRLRDKKICRCLCAFFVRRFTRLPAHLFFLAAADVGVSVEAVRITGHP
jgi:hypothetical protein